MAPSRLDWKIVDWDVKPQHKQTNKQNFVGFVMSWLILWNLNANIMFTACLNNS